MRDFYSIRGGQTRLAWLSRRSVRLVAIGLAAVLVPASVYAWHAAASAGEGNSSQSSPSRDDHKDAPDANIHSDNGNIHAQLNVSATSNQPAGSEQNASSHVSASVSGNTAATVTVNGRTTTLSPNSAIDQTITSNDNTTDMHVTMHSDSRQQATGSSSVDVQIMSDSEGGQ